MQLLPYIGICLQDMKDDVEYRSDWDQCSALLRNITSFEFIYTLFIACQIIGAPKELCVKLQGMCMKALWLARPAKLKHVYCV